MNKDAYLVYSLQKSEVIGWHDRSWTISISSMSLFLTVTSNNFISSGRYIQWNSSCKILES